MMSVKLLSIRIREIEENRLYMDADGLRMRERECQHYSAFLNPSLDILEFRRLAKKREEKTGEKVIYSRGSVEYTDVFVSMTMSKNSPTQLYETGFYVLKDGHPVRFLEYKRSGSAAKNGKHLFIREDFYEPMISWTWMGKPPVHERIHMSYVERKAYESLVNSSIKDLVYIDPEGILVLEDLEHSFETKAAMVGLSSAGKAEIHRKTVTISNMVTDGECLIDDSVFGSRDCGMMLLRNFFFKSCGFRTDIQGYYKEVFGNQYETATIEDCWGYPIPAKKIRMIVTKSSFKLFKFNRYFAIDEPRESMPWAEEGYIDIFQKSGLNSYMEWMDAVKRNGNVFGVVKYEETHREDRHFTYQMINSMNLSEEEVKELLEDDIQTYITLKTEDEAYESYVNSGRGSDADSTYTERFLMSMVQKNPKFRQTKVYKDKKYKFLKAYLQKLYEGKITISANYRTLCSMPWEYLQYSVCRDLQGIKPILNKGEVCILDIPDGEELVLCRNPHTCASNVVVARNRIPEEIRRWFSFQREDKTSNIVVLSPWEWDVMAALNGADFDSDEVLCIREPIVIRRAKELLKDEVIATIPHEVEGDFQHGGKLEQKLNDYESQNATDRILSNNKIGQISNYIQALNSYYWDCKHQINPALKEPETLYDDIQILSVLTGLEIDKAKHHYVVDTGRIARQLVEKHIDYSKDKPLFMRFLNEQERVKAISEAKHDKWLNCPMDYLAKQLFTMHDTREELVGLQPTPTIPLADLFTFEDYKGCDAKKTETVLDKLNYCIATIRRLNINKESRDWEVNARLKQDTLTETYDLMRKNKIKIKEMKRILSLILARDVKDLMKHKKIRDGFYQAFLVNNREQVGYVLETEYYKKIKELEQKPQTDYKKCGTLFEQYLERNPKTEEEILEFGRTIKKEKNLMNIIYVIQVLFGNRKYAAVRDEPLMALSILYLVWPELMEQCLRE